MTSTDSNPGIAATDLADASSQLEAIRSIALAGHRAVALVKIDTFLESNPDHPDALFTRAFVLFQRGRNAEARTYSNRASAAGCNHAEHLLQQGLGHLNAGDAHEAQSTLLAAIEKGPAIKQTYFALGAALQALGKWAESLPVVESGLALCPNDRDGLVLAGGAHLATEHLREAERYFRKAIEMDPGHSRSWMNLGVALARQSRNIEALATFHRAVDCDVDPLSNADAFVNLANQLRDAGDTQRAVDCYLSHLGAAQSVAGFFNFGLTCLAERRFREGWHYNEFRWLQQPLLSMRPNYQKPEWDGQDISRKSILIRGEQGFGDNFQFLRYAGFLKALGARVLLRPRQGMSDIACDISDIDLVLEPGHREHFDYYIHAMSLPRIFGTDENSIPSSIPYIAADPLHLAKWRPSIDRLAGLKVGVVWAGSPEHSEDKRRSVPFDTFSALFGSTSAHFFSLQKGRDADTICSHASANVTVLGDEILSFRDTAAIIALLDLVICVDTSVAHLAGAMGKPVWMLNALPGDWRWGREGETTPWYPKMRIFRQQTPGEWAPAVASMRDALQEVIAAGTVSVAESTTVSTKTAQAPLNPADQTAGLDLLGAVAETRFGIVQYLPDGSPVSTAIRWYGDYLTAHLLLFGPMIKPDSTVVEVGAGVGLHTLAVAAKIGASGNLIAFESDPRLRKVLRQNVAANGLRNVAILRELALSVADTSSTGHAADADRIPNIDELRLESLALIKINDEVNALNLLRTASETIWRLRPSIFAHVREKADAIRLGNELRDSAYRCWYVETPLYDNANFNCRRENMFGDAVAHAVMCMPEENDPGDHMRDCVELQ